MANYDNLVKALERGNKQLVDMVAAAIFLDEKGEPRQDQINDFIDQTGFGNKVEYIDEVKTNVGTINYKGQKFYYSPYVGGKK